MNQFPVYSPRMTTSMSSSNYPVYASVSQALLAQDWAALNRMYQHRRDKGVVLNEQDRLRWALARLHLGQPLEAVQDWLPDTVSDERTRSLLIRYGVVPLRQRGQLAAASALLERIEPTGQHRTSDGLKQLSLLMQAGQWTQALEKAGKMLSEEPENFQVALSLLRIMVRTGEREQALALARQYLEHAHDLSWARLLLPLMSASPQENEREWALTFVQDLPADTPPWLELAMQVHANAGHHSKVIELGERALQAGHDSVILHRLMAQAVQLQSSDSTARQQALTHWLKAYERAPDNEAVAASLADVLMRLGQHEQALPVLAKLVQKPRHRPYLNALYARALRQAGRYDEAVDQYRLLQQAQAESPKWPRYLASTLMLAGRRQEASDIFSMDLAQRRARLSSDFEQGLQSLHARSSTARIPHSRLDWAWSLRDPQRYTDRAEWTQRAVWGHLADHYLLDWLECRPELAEQAMQRLANLDQVEAFLQAENPQGGPWILASAHVGPMYAGPMALALLGINARWLASTPNLLDGVYSSGLISTTGLPETEVVRQSLATLQRGQSLVVAVDGALNLAAPTVTFEGQRITYSPFCARLAHKLNLPSAFVAPMWKGQEIDFWIERLPQVQPQESVHDYAMRWQAAYLNQLARYLRGAPENLRLSGGLWRQIR